MILSISSFNDLTAVVVAATGANVVGHTGIMALRAIGQIGHINFPMSAALSASCFGMSSFRIWHGNYYPFLLFADNSFFSGSNRGSICLTSQLHFFLFKFVLHWGHSPWQSSLQSGFNGSANIMVCLTISHKSARKFAS